MLIFSFVIGGILNIAFLLYSIDAHYERLYDSSTSEGIVSTGGVMTAIITLVIQLGIILSLFNLSTWYLNLMLY